MDKIKWCCNQKKGIELIEPALHLSESYMKEADEDIKESLLVGIKWKVVISYYACYEAFYSLLMKAGIKCEIHDCSLELMELFDFDEEKIKYLKKLKNLRTNNQYYLRRDDIEEKKIKEFVSYCKEKLEGLNQDRISEIRNKIEGIVNE